MSKHSTVECSIFPYAAAYEQAQTLAGRNIADAIEQLAIINLTQAWTVLKSN